MSQKEMWKDIKGYEELYEINVNGEVRRKDRICENGKTIKRHIIKPCLNSSGYKMVRLSKEGKVKHKFVHRLLLEMFAENINNYPCINHKDGNKLNNNLSNLEYCTYSYNNKEAYKLGLKKPYRKKVNQYTKDNIFLKTYNSILEASKITNIDRANIGHCCKNEVKTAGGYIWKYELEGIK